MYCCPFMRSPEHYRASYSITVNLKERKLHLIKNGKWFRAYPIAVGKILTKTPEGTYKIINKQVNPGGPFGARWMGLNRKGYGIHGTNNPASIGKAVSHGCIRMYNRDVIELFNMVNIGTIVKIV